MCLSEETHGIVELFRKDFEASADNQVWKDSENINYCNNFFNFQSWSIFQLEPNNSSLLNKKTGALRDIVRGSINIKEKIPDDT